MSQEPKKMDRRKFVWAGVGAAVIIVAGAAVYLGTRPATTVTSTLTSTTTSTAAPTTVTSTTTSTTATTLTTGTEVVTLWGISGPTYTTFTREAGLFENGSTAENEAAHPNVTILVEQSDESTFEATYNLRMATAPPPDFTFHYPGSWFTYPLAKAGYLYNLDDAIKKYGWSFDPGYEKYLFDPTTNSPSPNGHAYCMPQDYVAYPFIYYNPTIFTKLGVSVPTTIDELYSICSKAVSAGYLPVTFGYNTAPAWACNLYTFVLANLLDATDYDNFLSAYGYSLTVGNPSFKSRTVHWTDPTFIQAFTLEQEIASKIYAAGFLGMSDDDASGLFASGKSAMYQTGSWGPSTLDSLVTSFTFDAFIMPTDWSVISPPAIASVDNCLAICAKTNYPDICLEFMDFAISKAEQTLMANTGAFTCRNDLPSSIYTDPHMVTNSSLFTKYDPHMVIQLLINADLASEFISDVGSLMSGSMTAAAVAADLEKTAETVYASAVTTTTT